jgi:preprotein translocase subunit SecG
MNVLHWILLAAHIVACLFLIGVVLLQQGKGQDLASAFGGGVTQTAFGPRGSANILSRATTVLAAVFMITSLSLSVVRGRHKTFLDEVPASAAAPAPVPPANAPASAPAPANAAAPEAKTAPESKEPTAAAPGGDLGRPLTSKDVGPDAK